MADKKPDNEPVKVRIGLPLDADVAATLIQIIGLTYPRTLIGKPESALFQDREMVLLIDQRDRHKSAKAQKKYEKIRKNADGWVSPITELQPGGIGITPHQALTLSWIDMAKQTFEDHPDALNYVESTAYDRETGQKYVFYVAKSDKQTPHELRKQAEARVAELEAEIAQLKAGLDVDTLADTLRAAIKECVWWCNDWPDTITLDGDLDPQQLAQELLERLGVAERNTTPTEGESA